MMTPTKTDASMRASLGLLGAVGDESWYLGIGVVQSCEFDTDEVM